MDMFMTTRHGRPRISVTCDVNHQQLHVDTTSTVMVPCYSAYNMLCDT